MQRKKIIITGGSGFVGKYLTAMLLSLGYQIVVLDLFAPRNPKVDFVQANLAEGVPQHELLKNPYGYIHLAGKNIFGRFTPQHKKEIYNSRIVGTQNLVQLFKKEAFRPKVFVAASAVGFYGERGSAIISETTEHGGTFLSDVVQDWEKEIQKARFNDVRTVILRQGHIFGAGGFLAALIPTYTKWIGGSIGTGNQWLPWIAIQDLAHLYIESLENKNIEGVYNAVAKTQIQYKDFSHIFAKVLQKPNILRIPRWLLALRFGKEFAKEMTVSQRVVSHRLPQFDYQLQWNNLERVLQDVVEAYKK